MDFQLTIILLIFGILFIMEQIDNFSIRESFFNQNFFNKEYKPVNYSINFGNKEKNFGNFGTFGAYPPDPLCPSCDLKGDSVTSPYLHANDLGDQHGDQYGKVAIKCRSIQGKNYSDLNKPFLVAGRATGRPRQCRRIL